MKKIFFIGILLFLFEPVFSQATLLKEHCWKLEEVNIDNVTYTVPVNDEAGHVFLNINDSLIENSSFFNVSLCNFLYGNILLDDNEFIFDTFSNSDLECELEENNLFDDLYLHNFYIDYIDSPFTYSFNQEGNWLFLTITNANSDSAKYSVYIDETLTNSVWILEKVIYNQQEVYPPEGLNGQIEFLFLDASKEVTSGVRNAFYSIINVSENTLINSGGGVTFEDCEPQDFNDFDIIYIGGFFE